MVCSILDPTTNDLKTITIILIVKSRLLLMVGDFNQVLASGKKFYINPYTFSIRGIEKLYECLLECDFEDLESHRILFTWTSGRVEDLILRELDRALGNEI